MSRGTILYIGGFELPDKNAAAHRVLNNAKIFHSLEYKVKFLGISKENNKESITYQNFEMSSVPYPRSQKDWITYLTDFSYIKNEIERTSNLVSVICYNLPSILLNKVLKYSKVKKFKVIADVTEWYGDKRPIKYIDTSYRMKVLHKKCDAVICISKYLEQYYSKDVKTILLPPLIDISDSKWESVKSHKTAYLKLVYSGGLGRNKDQLSAIIRIVNELEDVKFKIVGITKQEYLQRNKEDRMIIDDDKIIFMGKVSHVEALDEVKKANFQIFIRENSRMNNAGFPTKFGESMACGTPVITTPVSDLRSYLIDGKNGYFVENDLIDLKEKLQDIQKLTEEEIFNMEKNCKSIKDFDYRSYITVTKSFLEDVLNK